MKNVKFFRPKNRIEFLFRIGGGGNDYGRTIQKLANHNLNFYIANNQQIIAIVK